MKFKITLKVPTDKIQILDEARQHYGVESIDKLLTLLIDKVCYDYILIKQSENTLTMDKIKNAFTLMRSNEQTSEEIHESAMLVEMKIREEMEKEFPCEE